MILKQRTLDGKKNFEIEVVTKHDEYFKKLEYWLSESTPTASNPFGCDDLISLTITDKDDNKIKKVITCVDNKIIREVMRLLNEELDKTADLYNYVIKTKLEKDLDIKEESKEKRTKV